VRDYLVEAGVVSPQCAASLIDNLDFKDAACLKATFTTLLGYALVLGAAVVKLPQLYNVVLKGAEGLSTLSLFIENLGFSVTIADAVQAGIPFDKYGESMFIVAQSAYRCLSCLTVPDLMLVFLILVYKRTLSNVLFFAASVGL